MHFLALVSFQAIEKPPHLDVDGIYMMLAMKEALIGLLLGLIAYMMISAVQIAGSFIDFQMGFAVANVIDPQTGAQSPLVGQFLYTMALLLMLSLNAHHLLLDGIYYSYQYIPVDKMALSFGSEEFAEFIAKASIRCLLQHFNCLRLLWLVCFSRSGIGDCGENGAAAQRVCRRASFENRDHLYHAHHLHGRYVQHDAARLRICHSDNERSINFAWGGMMKLTLDLQFFAGEKRKSDAEKRRESRKKVRLPKVQMSIRRSLFSSCFYPFYSSDLL